MRATVRVWSAPSVSAGRTRCASEPPPYPETGSQPSVTANTSASIIPSQNTGVEIPRTAAPMSAWSSAEPGRTAASAPAATPRTTATRVAASARRTVAGRRSASTSVTGRCSRREVPRSPRASRPSHVAYCTGSGRSSAYSRRRRSGASGSARWPSAARAGSPRAAAFSRKTSRVMPKSTGPSASSRPQSARPRSAIEPDLPERYQELGRGRERGALEPLHVPLDERAARVVIERDPRRVVDDRLLGLVVAPEARRPAGHRVRLVEQPVHGGVAVARGVAGGADVARVEEDREEVLGVRIVRDPALPEEDRAAVLHQLDLL